MRLLIALNILIFFSCCSQNHQIDFLSLWLNENSDFRYSSLDNYLNKRDIFKFNGSVKKITQTEHKVTLINDSVIKKEKSIFTIDNFIINYKETEIEKHYFKIGNNENIDIFNTEIYLMDKNGYLIKKTKKYPKAENKYKIESFEYKNNLIYNYKYFSSDIGDISYENFIHKDNRVISSKEYLVSDTDFFRHKVFEYAENEIIIKTEDKLDGDLHRFLTILKFYDNELVFIEKQFGGFNDTIKCVLNYDENHNLISKKEYINEDLVEELSYLYKYDDLKNWVEKRIYINQKLSYILEREIQYY